jgi:hypothetical protein
MVGPNDDLLTRVGHFEMTAFSENDLVLVHNHCIVLYCIVLDVNLNVNVNLMQNWALNSFSKLKYPVVGRPLYLLAIWVIDFGMFTTVNQSNNHAANLSIRNPFQRYRLNRGNPHDTNPISQIAGSIT